MTKQQHCCNDMTLSVQKEIIKFSNLTDDGTREFDTYYIECVKSKSIKNHLLIWEKLVVDTEDILLHYCPHCGKGL